MRMRIRGEEEEEEEQEGGRREIFVTHAMMELRGHLSSDDRAHAHTWVENLEKAVQTGDETCYKGPATQWEAEHELIPSHIDVMGQVRAPAPH